MTKQNLMQLKAYYTLQIEKATKRISEAEQEYIIKNADYPVGTKLLIDDYGTSKEVQIQKYRIDENGLLIPVFFTLHGKRQFVNNPTIIKQLD